MFSMHPAPAPASAPATAQTTSTPTPALAPSNRSSRLRGLSYLRNYTQTHLGLSREHAHAHAHAHAHTSAADASNYHQPNSNSNAAAAAAAAIASSFSLAPVHATSALSTNTSPSLLAPAGQRPLQQQHQQQLQLQQHQQQQQQQHLFNSSAPSTSPPSGRPGRFSFGLQTPWSNGLTQAGGAVTTSSGRRSTESSVIPTIVTSNVSGSGAVAAPAHTAEGSANMARARSATTGDATPNHNGSSVDVLPSIRFSTFFDPRAPRPSLKFSPVSRTLPTGKEVIRVGRYSDRDTQPNVNSNAPSAAPVGFKSKVVSRRHCEFWYEDGKWYIRDVKSSSGTFLNHIRLSPPGTESKPFPVNDGDIVQLGIDFKGGEEMIFRCVKMRLELNRGWQSKLNTFNMNTHKRLRNMTTQSSASSQYSQDCSICLNSIAPCQCLFVAPCSHTWHYKCIRSLLASPSYPIFICPNCRAAADLEAEVEDPEEWAVPDKGKGDSMEDDDDAQSGPPTPKASAFASLPPPAAVPAALPPVEPRRSIDRNPFRNNMTADTTGGTLVSRPTVNGTGGGGDVTLVLDSQPQVQSPAEMDGSSLDAALPIRSVSAGAAGHAMSSPMHITSPSQRGREARTPSPTGAPVAGNGPEGPITPRNDAGPWVFDGSGMRVRDDGSGSTTGGGAPVQGSLEAAVAEGIARAAATGTGS